MTRDEAVAEVKRVLGYRTDKDAEIVTTLNYAQSKLEQKPTLPAFLREEILTMVSVAGDERLPFPPGFLKEWTDSPMRIRSVSDSSSYYLWTKLSKDTEEYLRDSVNIGEGTPGIPKAYMRDNTSFILFPTPDDVYTFRMIYYKADVVPADGGSTNKWLTKLPYLLIGTAGVRIAASMRDKEALPIFTAMMNEGLADINEMNTEVDEAGARPVVGGPD